MDAKIPMEDGRSQITHSNDIQRTRSDSAETIHSRETKKRNRFHREDSGTLQNPTSIQERESSIIEPTSNQVISSNDEKIEVPPTKKIRLSQELLKINDSSEILDKKDIEVNRPQITHSNDIQRARSDSAETIHSRETTKKKRFHREDSDTLQNPTLIQDRESSIMEPTSDHAISSNDEKIEVPPTKKIRLSQELLKINDSSEILDKKDIEVNRPQITHSNDIQRARSDSAETIHSRETTKKKRFHREDSDTLQNPTLIQDRESSIMEPTSDHAISSNDEKIEVPPTKKIRLSQELLKINDSSEISDKKDMEVDDTQSAHFNDIEIAKDFSVRTFLSLSGLPDLPNYLSDENLEEPSTKKIRLSQELLKTNDSSEIPDKKDVDDFMDLSYRSLRCLTDLPNFIRKLNLSNNALSDSNMILDIAHLEELDLSSNRFQEIPKNLPKSLKKLSIAHNFLEATLRPPSLPNLVYLNLSNNCFKEIPYEMIGNSLETLKMPNNLIKDISLIQHLVSLKTLDLSHNLLTEIPFDLVKSIEKLDVSFNNLSSLPHQLKGNLKKLDVSHNTITIFSCELSISIEELDISFNLLEQFPVFPQNMNIEILNLSNNRLKELSLSSLNKLQKLDASNNQLVSIPECLQDCCHLKIFNLSFNKINAIKQTDVFPDSLKQLFLSSNALGQGQNPALILPLLLNGAKNLIVLDLSRNSLAILPETLPSSLKILNLSHNKLWDIQELIPLLNKLKILDLSHNELNQISDNVPNSLTILDASYNNITYVSLAKLTHLKNLNLSDCNIEVIDELPKSLEQLDLSFNILDKFLFSHLNKLKTLNLMNNSFTSISPLPNSLEKINLSMNFIKSLPVNIHGQNLKELNLSNNRIKIINTTFPESLQILDLSYNFLASIEKITSVNLKRLDLSVFDLRRRQKTSSFQLSLDVLPSSLDILIISNWSLIINPDKPKRKNLLILPTLASEEKLTEKPEEKLTDDKAQPITRRSPVMTVL